MAIIEGTSADNTLPGTEFDDRISGFGGNDTLDGDLGNDSVYGGLGDDLIFPGDGDDRAWGGAGNDTLRGGYGNQTLYGGADDDWVLPGADDPFFHLIRDPVGHHVAYGGDGNDLLQALGRFTADLFGGDGIDTAKLLYYSAAWHSMLVRLTGPDAGMIRSDGQFLRFDSIERLEFYADTGDHEVHGGDLDDIIHVGAGNDVVHAGAGDDQVGYRPNTGHYLDGGSGNDTLTVEGISGQAVYFVVDGTGAVDDGMLSTIQNFEAYHVFGQGRANDFIALWQGNDTAEGFAGNDNLYGRGGDDRLFGGFGDDGLGGGDGADSLFGGAGNDVVSGDAGNDRLIGLGGADTLYGGDDNDVLNGGAGDDWLSGGNGADRFVFGAWDAGGDLIVDFISGTDQLRFAADLLAGAPGWTGRATADDFAVGQASLAQGQFVLSYLSFANLTELLWDADGTAGNAPLQRLVTLNGIVTVAAEDIWIV